MLELTKASVRARTDSLKLIQKGVLLVFLPNECLSKGCDVSTDQEVDGSA